MQYEFNLFKSQLDRRFEEFHEANPKVYEMIVDAALRLKEVGHKRMSVKAIYEGLRWETALKTTDPDFKLNNSYTSRYSRLIEANEEQLAGFFSKRQLRS